MATKRLGKGLSAIIKTDVNPLDSKNGVTLLPLDSIKTNPNQPRKNFEKDALSDLASSIKKKGVITPITVRPNPNNNGYMIVAGERRYRSSLIARKKNIPAYILNISEDSELMEIALIENIQREDLNAIEESEAYLVLQEKFNFSPEKIAESVGKNRSTIVNSMRLLKLPAEIKKSLIRNEISAGHGRALLALNTRSAMLKLWKKILSNKLSVRQTEELSKNSIKSLRVKKIKKISFTSQIDSIEKEMISLLGTKVSVKHKKNGSGSLMIKYYSNDDLERLLELLKSIEKNK